jgi:hypothetical protein
MATSRTALSQDDHGVAAVVGFVLILAVAISYYAYVAKSDVPRWGEENENAWNENVGNAMTALARDAGTGVVNHASIAGTVPQPPEPHSFDVPLIGRTQPVPPDGTIAMQSGCAFWNVTQPGGPMFTSTANGCLDFQASPVYTAPFGWRVEYGGLLKLQGTSAFLASGPPLKLRVLKDDTGTPVQYQIAITLIDLRGPGKSGSASSANVPVDLIAGTGAVDSTLSTPDSVTWEFKTKYPDAWKNWLDGRLRGADFEPAAYSVVKTADGVSVTIFGPSTANPALVAPLSLSVTQGVYDVNIR